MSNLPFSHLSASSLNAFGGYGSCELSWKFRYIDGLPRKPFGHSLLAGRAFDKALEHVYRGKLDEKPLSPEDAADAFHTTWRREQFEAEYDLSEAGRTMDRGIAATREHVEVVTPRVRPAAVQRRVSVAFDEVEWTLDGWVDLVEVAETGGVIVTDHKSTCSSSTRYDEAKAANDLQLGIYDVALTSEGEAVAGRGFRSARLLKTKHELGEAMVRSSAEQRATTLDLLGMLAGRVEDACATGSFLPTAFISGSWKCSSKFCDYFDEVCDFGARARVSIPLSGAAA